MCVAVCTVDCDLSLTLEHLDMLDRIFKIKPPVAC